MYVCIMQDLNGYLHVHVTRTSWQWGFCISVFFDLNMFWYIWLIMAVSRASYEKWWLYVGRLKSKVAWRKEVYVIEDLKTLHLRLREQWSRIISFSFSKERWFRYVDDRLFEWRTLKALQDDLNTPACSCRPYERIVTDPKQRGLRRTLHAWWGKEISEAYYAMPVKPT